MACRLGDDSTRPPALLDGTAEHTKAQVAVPVARHDPAAVRRTADAGVDVPTAAPEHPARARCSTSRIGRRAARVFAMPVLAPLPHVAVHVIQTPPVRLLTHPRDVPCRQSSCYTRRNQPALIHCLRNCNLSLSQPGVLCRRTLNPARPLKAKTSSLGSEEH